MTTIAWDGAALAGDRLGDYGGTKVTIRKVFAVKNKRGERYLIGGAGGSGLLTAWRRWVEGLGPEPVINRDDDFAAIMVDERRRVWKVEWNLQHVRYRDRFMALGSGRGEAIGAMAMGATARQAILVASRHDIGTGRGVDVVKFR
jgi:hypothetical protein